MTGLHEKLIDRIIGAYRGPDTPDNIRFVRRLCLAFLEIPSLIALSENSRIFRDIL